MSETQEGVIQFQYQLTKTQPAFPAQLIEQANQGRNKMLALGWMGQDPERYQGLGFGNLSLRFSHPEYPSAFMITASQTGQLANLNACYWTWVVTADPAANQVRAQGLHPPSSEAMSHAAIYQANPAVKAVIHIHSPELWASAQQQGVACTARHLPYGTPAMAKAIAQEVTNEQGLLVMLGHQDGILSWGPQLTTAANQLYALASNPS